MSPTSISGGGNLLTGGELISPASCDAKLVPVGKGQEEVLPSAKLEQWPYKINMHTLGLVSRKHKIYGESIDKIYNVLVLTMHTFK